MKGQGSIEYLLLFIAVLAGVAVVLVILSSLMSSPSEQRGVQIDIIECSNSHMWLKEYTTPYDPSSQASALSTSPGFLSYYDGELAVKSTGTGSLTETDLNKSKNLFEMCKLQNKYPLYYDGTTAYLDAGPTGTQMKYVKYSRAGTPPTSTIITATSTQECLSSCQSNDYWRTTITYYGKITFQNTPLLSGTSGVKICATAQTMPINLNADTLKIGTEPISTNQLVLETDDTYCMTVDPTKIPSGTVEINWEGTAANEWKTGVAPGEETLKPYMSITT